MTPWVMRLVVANVVMFFLTAAVPGLAGNLALVPALVPVRPWTPFTYMFVHAGAFHLMFNMMGLFFFGPQLEARLGSARFLRLYLVSGLAGALFSLATPHVAIVGASAATLGVFVGFARYWPRAQVLFMGFVPLEARTMVILMTVISIVLAKSPGSGIAHLAHLGGVVGGWLYLRAADARSTATAFRQVARAAPQPAPAAVERWRRIDRATLHPVNAEEVERVLAKMETLGANSLTADERAFLERFAGS
ncbi:MAG TPA: rhomboid family intramembrane serine protease [Gemmatimonadales bacterium]|nr:rhomboid family intramembrane serine protease [Gemmatimonadales bacterium]